ncbi:MAG: hypothetical protein ACRD8U_02905, partial [Pyrinomonadaceae bacterium]
MTIALLLGMSAFILGKNQSYASPAFAIFQREVHPHLLKRCQMCHGINQVPMHSQKKPQEAYKEARELISLRGVD